MSLDIIYYICCNTNGNLHSLFRPVPNYLTATVDTVLAIHRDQSEGDVLAFLTGQVNNQTPTLTDPVFCNILVTRPITSNNQTRLFQSIIIFLTLITKKFCFYCRKKLNIVCLC